MVSNLENLDNDLARLNSAVKAIIHHESFSQTVEQLSRELQHSQEPFVWSVIPLNSITQELPANIKSGWIFLLKQGVPSGCHFHPNSIQHMVTIKGKGTSKIAGEHKRMVLFDEPNNALTDIWYVIAAGVPHEFFPEDEDVLVVSFHTCQANELEEIACGTGEIRIYEKES